MATVSLLKTEWKYAETRTDFVKNVVCFYRNNEETETMFELEIQKCDRFLSRHPELRHVPVNSLSTWCYECWSEKMYNSERESWVCVRCK